mmetsp:Transcript_3138/g.11248  ORF Transcript_3138/g.11248 Transcript_3138/m.11248 type:complete len:396 (-) Transcript_3138:755-1942(-)
MTMSMRSWHVKVVSASRAAASSTATTTSRAFSATCASVSVRSGGAWNLTGSTVLSANANGRSGAGSACRMFSSTIDESHSSSPSHSTASSTFRHANMGVLTWIGSAALSTTDSPMRRAVATPLRTRNDLPQPGSPRTTTMPPLRPRHNACRLFCSALCSRSRPTSRRPGASGSVSPSAPEAPSVSADDERRNAPARSATSVAAYAMTCWSPPLTRSRMGTPNARRSSSQARAVASSTSTPLLSLCAIRRAAITTEGPIHANSRRDAPPTPAQNVTPVAMPSVASTPSSSRTSMTSSAACTARAASSSCTIGGTPNIATTTQPLSSSVSSLIHASKRSSTFWMARNTVCSRSSDASEPSHTMLASCSRRKHAVTRRTDPSHPLLASATWETTGSAT